MWKIDSLQAFAAALDSRGTALDKERHITPEVCGQAKERLVG
jgi:hypothetical protein